MDNLSFGEKAYSAAKVTAVLDALACEDVRRSMHLAART